MKKVFGLFAFLLVAMGLVPVSSGADLTPMYIGVSNIDSALSINGGQAQCSGNASIRNSYSADLTVTLQKQNGTQWTYVTSWSDNGTVYVSAGGSVAAIKGSSYRVVAKATVKDASGNTIETVSSTSPTKTY